METHRGTGRSTLLKPHTQFCGCCCSLKTGVITGCSLFILLYSVAIIGVIGEATERSPDPTLAHAFCDLDLDYRAAYND